MTFFSKGICRKIDSGCLYLFIVARWKENSSDDLLLSIFLDKYSGNLYKIIKKYLLPLKEHVQI